MIKNASYISPPIDAGNRCPYFTANVHIEKKLKRAELSVTATGVYIASVNGVRAGDFILAPGITAYNKRLQYQNYDVTDLMRTDSIIKIELGKGWFRGRLSEDNPSVHNTDGAVIAALRLDFEDGTSEEIYTDDTWQVYLGKVMFSDIYDGEYYSAAEEDKYLGKAVVNAGISKEILIAQEGEQILEHERLNAENVFITPKGERVIDFGQNIAGYVEICADAHKGEKISVSFAEVLDKDGCFYTDNYRSAKCEMTYICREGLNRYKAQFTFYGFRYIRINECPDSVTPDCFTAIAIYSDMQRTGFVKSGSEKLNKLFENTLWSQKDNFIDIPTDCPQRDERRGWTGDAQVFCKTACYNFNVKRFFEKWLADMRAEQTAEGAIPEIIPNQWNGHIYSAVWSDAVTIIPWQLYLMYGDKKLLEDNFDAMHRWVDFITSDTKDKYLWTESAENRENSEIKHFGDWLALDAPEGSYSGSTRNDFIASAFYAYSTSLVIKAGKAIGREVSEYEELYKNTVKAFRKAFTVYRTQTECVLALYFDLAENKAEAAKQLNKMILENGCKLKTGFVGTPYLLHALSDNGYTKTAYGLLLQEEYPSWLYEVNHGATTIWEHWDGIKPDGSFWSADMNSYNHYAYGSVFDWVYSVAGGIKPSELKPGFEEAIIEPKPDKRLGKLEISYKVPKGVIKSAWHYNGDKAVYKIETPVKSKIIIDEAEYIVEPGVYNFLGIA